MFINRTFLAVILSATILSGCALQRAQDAENAKAQMIGMTKENVFECMGPPAQKSTEGKTEIWSYPSGNGHVDSMASGSAFSNGTANVYGNSANATVSTFGIASGFSERRFCVVNLVISKGKVQAIHYNGPTGGLLTKGEQCAYAIENCVKHNTSTSNAE